MERDNPSAFSVRLPTDQPVCDHCSGTLSAIPGADWRCACGSLLGRRVGSVLEVKCRRCKRVVRISLAEADEPR